MGIPLRFIVTPAISIVIGRSDIIPRAIAAKEWAVAEQGLTQRLQALNMFIDDIYNGQKC